MEASLPLFADTGRHGRSYAQCGRTRGPARVHHMGIDRKTGPVESSVLCCSKLRCGPAECSEEAFTSSHGMISRARVSFCALLLIASLSVCGLADATSLDGWPFDCNRNATLYGDTKLGHCTTATIYTKGCALACFAMIYNYYTPGFTDLKKLNESFTRNGGFLRGDCNINWEVLSTDVSTMNPSNLRFQDAPGDVKRGVNQNNFATDMNYRTLFLAAIDAELAAGDPVLASVRYEEGVATKQHFVVIIGVDDQGNHTIADPYYSLSTGKAERILETETRYRLEYVVFFDRRTGGGLPPTPSHTTATVLVMDVSGSMAWSWKGGVKIDSAKKAALQFIEQVANEPRLAGTIHEIGLVTFSGDAQLALPRTSSYAQARNAVIQLQTVTSTNIGAGLSAAIRELDGLRSAERFIILLSDGESNTGLSKDQILAGPVAEARTKGICIYTVAFGDPGDIDENFLRRVAQGSGCGTYSYAASGFQLFGTYMKVRHSMLGSNRIVDFTSGSSPVMLLSGQSALLGAFQLTAPAQELHYTLAWSEPGRMTAILVDPSNKQVTTSYPGATLYSGNGFTHVAVRSPRPGVWRVSAVASTSFAGGVQYYGVASARTGGIVIPYRLPDPFCITVLGTKLCVPMPDMPTVLVVGVAIVLAAVALYRFVLTH